MLACFVIRISQELGLFRSLQNRVDLGIVQANSINVLGIHTIALRLKALGFIKYEAPLAPELQIAIDGVVPHIQDRLAGAVLE